MVHDHIKEFYEKVGELKGPYSASTKRFAPTAPTKKIIQIATEMNAKCILDIGCGMGTSIFDMAGILAQDVKFIGIDCSHNMIAKAMDNLSEHHELEGRVKFIVGEAEDLPVVSGEIDLVFSECVFNLAPNRRKLISEVNRVLKKGGRIAYSDYVSFQDVPFVMQNNKELSCGCQSGSLKLSSNIQELEIGSFVNIECYNFDLDKKVRKKELEKSSEEIKKSNEILAEKNSEIVKFMDDHISYYLLTGIKLEDMGIQKCACCC